MTWSRAESLYQELDGQVLCFWSVCNKIVSDTTAQSLNGRAAQNRHFNASLSGPGLVATPHVPAEKGNSE